MDVEIDDMNSIHGIAEKSAWFNKCLQFSTSMDVMEISICRYIVLRTERNLTTTKFVCLEVWIDTLRLQGAWGQIERTFGVLKKEMFNWQVFELIAQH